MLRPLAIFSFPLTCTTTSGRQSCRSCRTEKTCLLKPSGNLKGELWLSAWPPALEYIGFRPTGPGSIPHLYYFLVYFSSFLSYLCCNLSYIRHFMSTRTPPSELAERVTLDFDRTRSNHRLLPGSPLRPLWANRRRPSPKAATKQLIKLFANAGADAIKDDWIDTRIQIMQDESDSPENVPVWTEIFIMGVKVKKQHKNMTG